MKRLPQRDDFAAAFKALLNILSLWRDGLRLGVMKDILQSFTISLYGSEGDEDTHNKELCRVKDTIDSQ